MYIIINRVLVLDPTKLVATQITQLCRRAANTMSAMQQQSEPTLKGTNGEEPWSALSSLQMPYLGQSRIIMPYGL
jgi:hypothetical protein